LIVLAFVLGLAVRFYDLKDGRWIFIPPANCIPP
jgi:hypothetical protein